MIRALGNVVCVMEDEMAHLAQQPLRRLRIPEHVVFRRFGDQTVLLNLETGQYHGVNATGGRILELLGEIHDPAETALRVAEEFGVAVERVSADVDQLCRALLERGLIAADDG